MNRRTSVLTLIVTATALLCVQPGILSAGTGDGSVASITKVQDSGPDNARFNIVIMGDGYRASEMDAFEDRAQEVIDAFNSQAVYGACGSSVNFYRVNIESDDSGVDKPTPCYGSSTLRDTYLDTKYCGDGSTQRCIGTSNWSLVNTTAESATAHWSFVLVLVNDTEHGGCRWGDVSFSSTGAGFENIAVHELGHAIGNLADEYEEFTGTYAGGEPVQANITTATTRQDLKWRDLVLATTPLPTWEKTDCGSFSNPPATWGNTVGVFEGGGRHNTCDIYRPQRTCLMRSSSQPFCAVCAKRLSRDLVALSPDADLSITPWGFFKEPKESPWWQTADIWVDNDADGTQEADEPAIGKADNHLFARVTNVGADTSSTYQVSFSYVPYTGVIDMANRQHITTISRPALASGGVDEVEVLWDLTSVPPEFAGIDHFCVIVEIETDECATYNNQAQNNFMQVQTVGPSPAPVSFYVKNILPQPATGRVTIEPRPPAWQVEANVADLDAIALQPNEEKLITVEFKNEDACDRGTKPLVAEQTVDSGICARQDFDLSFELEGDVLGGVSSEVVVQRRDRKASFHLGATVPTGDLDDLYGSGLMVGLDVDYRLNSRWSLVTLLAYHEFTADSSFVSDTYLWNAAVNGKLHLGSGTLRPYLNGGLGVYIPESGSSEPGANVGFGVEGDLPSGLTLEVGGDYHYVDGGDAEYLVGKIGVLWRF